MDREQAVRVDGRFAKDEFEAGFSVGGRNAADRQFVFRLGIVETREAHGNAKHIGIVGVDDRACHALPDAARFRMDDGAIDIGNGGGKGRLGRAGGRGRLRRGD